VPSDVHGGDTEKGERVKMYRRIQPAPPEPWREYPSRPYDQAQLTGNALYETATFERLPESDPTRDTEGQGRAEALAEFVLTELERERQAIGVDEWDEADTRTLAYCDAWEILGEDRSYEVVNRIDAEPDTDTLIDRGEDSEDFMAQQAAASARGGIAYLRSWDAAQRVKGDSE
jgi:hypothetical protein